MAAFAGPLQLERDPTFAAVLRMHQGANGAGTRERPVEGRIREWQSTAGNAAVTQMLQRQAAPDEAGGAGGATAPTATHSKLQYGATGDEVRDLQQRLNDQKATRIPLVIDGIFGRKTQAAVRRYQETHPPIAIDGDAGPETWAALDKAEPGARAAPPDEATTDPHALGKEHYAAGRYGRAYDAFTKAYEETGDPAHLWNRAQTLRLLGGRREEAIALYEQLIKATSDVAVIAEAREKIAELRGPGSSGDAKKDKDVGKEFHRKGRELYEAEEYNRAYDEFTKAWEASGDVAFLWNRAQALRLAGGRRAETISLYEQFITKDVPEDRKKAAIAEIADLKGPGKTADDKANLSASDQLYRQARQSFSDERYAQAYDDFSKAYEITGAPGLLYNRAQCLKLLGGRRDQAITLFEQFIASNVSEDARKAARAHLEDLKARGKKQAGGPAQPPS